MPIPEFPCDRDLVAYLESGEMDTWQAMSMTTSRDAARCRELLESLQKKTERLESIINEHSNNKTKTILPRPAVRD